MRQVVGTFPTWATKVGLADLWTITLITGQVLRWTSADVPITAFGVTFGSGPIIERGSTRVTSDLEVDTLDVTLMTGAAITLLGLPLPQAAANGALDGATVKLERAYMQSWGTVDATVHLFEGRVSQVLPSHTQVKIQVKSLLELLDIQWPRNLYQPACTHQLYGAGCGVSRAAFQATGLAFGGTTTTVRCSNGWPAGYWEMGVVTFTGGQNAGARRTVKSADTSGLVFALPLTYPVSPGDTFVIVPGCDKTTDTCGGTFNNLTRFRGCPWVPKPETAR